MIGANRRQPCSPGAHKPPRRALAVSLFQQALRRGGDVHLHLWRPQPAISRCPANPSIAAHPAAPIPRKSRRWLFCTPPKAITGIVALCASAANRRLPSAFPPGCDRVGSKGDKKTRSAPIRSAARNSRASCTAMLCSMGRTTAPKPRPCHPSARHAAAC
jgi:hypothetical protein